MKFSEISTQTRTYETIYYVLLHRALLFQKYSCLFFQKMIFSTSFGSTTCGKVKHELRFHIHELRVRIHESRVQIHELED